jgi:hypothetical protein
MTSPTPEKDWAADIARTLALSVMIAPTGMSLHERNVSLLTDALLSVAEVVRDGALEEAALKLESIRRKADAGALEYIDAIRSLKSTTRGEPGNG